MRAYLITTAIVFGLITLAHVLRMFTEGWDLAAREPLYLALTLAAAGLCVWAAILLRRMRPPRNR